MNYRSGLSRDQFESLALDMISAHILQTVRAAGKASLLLSGGSTPGPIYQKLSQRPLPWDQVDIGLVDERWVAEDDTGSNAALIRRTLLSNNAAAAKFTPMKTDHTSPQEAQDDVDALYGPLVSGGALAVLGMGTDGHVCSWFPKSEGLSAALDPANTNVVQAITAKKSDVTGDYLERMTLTLSALAQCKSVLLLITGDDKRRVFESKNPDLPISHLLNTDTQIDLTVLHAG